MPNRNNVPLMNIIERPINRLGEGHGEYRCRYYCNNEKKTKYIAYQYGARTTSDEAYDKVKIKRDEIIKILEEEVAIHRKEREERLANKSPPQKRGRKPLPPEIKEQRKRERLERQKARPRVEKIVTVRDMEGNIIQATLVVRNKQ